MDQQKIGKFIAQRRKEKGLTQSQLAEALNITNRAVSKWETGNALPDSSLMLELCRILDISVNDLLNGEVVSTEDYGRKMENRLLEALQQKEHLQKQLIRNSSIFIALGFALFALLSFQPLIYQLPSYWPMTFAVLAIIVMGFAVDLWVRVFRKTGKFRCEKCGHTYTPSYWAINFSFIDLHKRFLMRCPNCKKARWHKITYQED